MSNVLPAALKGESERLLDQYVKQLADTLTLGDEEEK